MKILKMLLLAGLGYAFYEFFGHGSGGSDGGEPRGATITGPGQGTMEITEDADGTSIPHRVGRGVIHH